MSRTPTLARKLLCLSAVKITSSDSFNLSSARLNRAVSANPKSERTDRNGQIRHRTNPRWRTCAASGQQSLKAASASLSRARVSRTAQTSMYSTRSRDDTFQGAQAPRVLVHPALSEVEGAPRRNNRPITTCIESATGRTRNGGCASGQLFMNLGRFSRTYFRDFRREKGATSLSGPGRQVLSQNTQI